MHQKMGNPSREFEEKFSEYFFYSVQIHLTIKQLIRSGKISRQSGNSSHSLPVTLN